MKKNLFLILLLAPAVLSAAAGPICETPATPRKDSVFIEKHRFLPTAKRIDRGIGHNKFAYK